MSTQSKTVCGCLEVPRKGPVAATPAPCPGFRVALSLRLHTFRAPGVLRPQLRGCPGPARPPRPEQSCALCRCTWRYLLLLKRTPLLLPSHLLEATGWVTEMQLFDFLSLKLPQGLWSGVWEWTAGLGG